MTTRNDGGPATPAEAEELAKQAVQQYLSACRVTGSDQPGNYLMKLCSVAGVVIACAEGPESAAKRLEGTARFIRKRLADLPTNMEPLQ